MIAVQKGESAAQAQPAAAAKKSPAKPKQKTPEWHGEAAPREVVPGEKVLAALIELGTTRMSAGRYDEALKAFTDAVSDRVKALRGSMSGTIVRLLPDGRVVWHADSGAELIALPESLIREKSR